MIACGKSQGNKHVAGKRFGSDPGNSAQPPDDSANRNTQTSGSGDASTDDYLYTDLSDHDYGEWTISSTDTDTDIAGTESDTGIATDSATNTGTKTTVDIPDATGTLVFWNNARTTLQNGSETTVAAPLPYHLSLTGAGVLKSGEIVVSAVASPLPIPSVDQTTGNTTLPPVPKYPAIYKYVPGNASSADTFTVITNLAGDANYKNIDHELTQDSLPMQVQADDSILVMGTVKDKDLALFKFTGDTTSASFNVGENVWYDSKWHTPISSVVNDFRMQNDGKIVVCGAQTIQPAGGSKFSWAVIRRFDKDMVLDPTFNAGDTPGVLKLTFVVPNPNDVAHPFSGPESSCNGLIQLADGSFIATGQTTVLGTNVNGFISTDYAWARRILPDGTIDGNYHKLFGRSQTPGGDRFAVSCGRASGVSDLCTGGNTIIGAPGGGVLIGGYRYPTNNDTPTLSVWKLDAGGVLVDGISSSSSGPPPAAFGIAGAFTYFRTGTTTQVVDMVAHPSGKITLLLSSGEITLRVGRPYKTMGLARLQPNGEIDTSFAGGGLYQFPGFPATGSIASLGSVGKKLLVLPNGNLVVFGADISIDGTKIYQAAPPPYPAIWRFQ